MTLGRRATPGARVGPALAILEVQSIARGYRVLDAACKRAVVTVVQARTVTPGRFWIALTGGEAEVDEALAAGIDAAGDARMDHVLLPAVAWSVLCAVAGETLEHKELDAIGVLELASLSATVCAADAAVKAAEVTLVDLHLARSIGGKGVLVVTGVLSDVEAAVEAGAEAAGVSRLVGREVIARPDEAVHTATPFPHWNTR